MDAYILLKLLHLLGFCYWLGGDIGVFYSSGFVVKSDLSREQRLMAGKIMLALDLVPRICMSITLTVGGLLATQLGIVLAAWQLLVVCLLGPVWLGLVLFLHFNHGSAGRALTVIDKVLRWAVICSIVFFVSRGFMSETTQAPWLLLKLAGFAVLVFLGLMIRAGFGGFAAGYAALLKGEPTAEENASMQSSLNTVRPFVLAIWVVLVFEAYLGIAKPYW